METGEVLEVEGVLWGTSGGKGPTPTVFRSFAEEVDEVHGGRRPSPGPSDLEGWGFGPVEPGRSRPLTPVEDPLCRRPDDPDDAGDGSPGPVPHS